LPGGLDGVFGSAIKAPCREQKLHATILPIKNATQICETGVLAKADTRP
jgi:hypothetical protein